MNLTPLQIKFKTLSDSFKNRESVDNVKSVVMPIIKRSNKKTTKSRKRRKQRKSNAFSRAAR